MVRLDRIGNLAAELCYKDNTSTCRENICIGRCAAVCPFEYLQEAAQIVFDEYWNDLLKEKL
jgi:hypothetical protein